MGLGGILLLVWMGCAVCGPQKMNRGLRCTAPFCDFECLREDNCAMCDLGGDIDITDDIVSMDACMHDRARAHSFENTHRRSDGSAFMG